MNTSSDLLQIATGDEATQQHFLTIWKPVESILEAFSRVTKLPIFVYLNGHFVFQSSLGTMPGFCQLMLTHDETKQLCCENGKRRADKIEPDIIKRVQICHSGMVNGRREIYTEVGTMVILFGSRKSNLKEAKKRKNNLIGSVEKRDPILGKRLREADEKDQLFELPEDNNFFDKEDLSLINAISDLIEQFLRSTVGFRVSTTNMAHELTLILNELGQMAALNFEMIEEMKNGVFDADLLGELHTLNSVITSESRLGLYLVRNIFSHSSETKYNQVNKPSFTVLEIGELLNEMIDLYKWRAKEKNIRFVTQGVDELPNIFGSEMEMRRVFHNVFNNAIKYSYHTVPSAQRIIRLTVQNPYDPGFRKPTFAISVENYGLGLTDEEQRIALKPGFRGSQAKAEVPMGAGIGLSEIEKIMRLHKGQVKIESKIVHTNADNTSTYVTTVKLIFPLRKNSY